MDDLISRQAAENKLTELVAELEGIFSDIRERLVDDSVCGLCEYDCDHGIDGSANECPGYERGDCFKLRAETRKEWTDTSDIPSAEPCEDAISRLAAIYYVKSHIAELITESGIDKNAHTNSVLRAIINGIETMPSVTPTRSQNPERNRPESIKYCENCNHIEMCLWYPTDGCEFRDAGMYERGYNDAKREIALSGEYERAYERGKADARPKGKWIPIKADCRGYTFTFECSECHGYSYEDAYTIECEYDWCPRCGADMKGGKEDGEV